MELGLHKVLSGPNDFQLVINDLTFNTCYAKYVDDITVLSVSKDVNDVTLQTAADHLVHWAQNNGMMINTNKTKELIICFNKTVNADDISPLCINGNNIERVTTFKLHGVFVSSGLSWDYHVTYLLRKVAKRIYCINYLFRAGVPTSDIVCVYTSIIRSVLEYACPVWHPGLPKNCLKTMNVYKNAVLNCCFQLFHILSHYVKVALNV